MNHGALNAVNLPAKVTINFTFYPASKFGNVVFHKFGILKS
ncbi:hypothetical protein BH11BAC5_BH11BAC5_36890 [soil metagenome]